MGIKKADYRKGDILNILQLSGCKKNVPYFVRSTLSIEIQLILR
jgi:hypothetical protein